MHLSLTQINAMFGVFQVCLTERDHVLSVYVCSSKDSCLTDRLSEVSERASFCFVSHRLRLEYLSFYSCRWLKPRPTGSI